MKNTILLFCIAFFLSASCLASSEPKEAHHAATESSISDNQADSTLHKLDVAINSAKLFIKEKDYNMYSVYDALILLSVDKRFKLGLDKLYPEARNVELYMHLYNSNYNDGKFKIPVIPKGDTLIELRSMMKEGQYSRNVWVSVCDQLNTPPAFIDDLYNKSQTSDSSLIDVYALFTEYISKGCYDPNSKVKEYKRELSNQLISLISKDNASPFYKIKATAFLLYGHDIDIKHQDILEKILKSQSKEGSWKVQSDKSESIQEPINLYGLWTLCSWKQILEDENKK